MLKIVVVIIALLSFVSHGFAKDNQHHVCNQHRFTFLLLHVYDVSLCANTKQQLSFNAIYQDSFSLTIHYNMNFDKEELSQSSLEEIRRYYTLSQDQESLYYQNLMRIFPNVKKGDVIEARYNQDGQTDFYHNQRLTGSITSVDFSRKFLDIWLHQNNKYQKMVQDLLK